MKNIQAFFLYLLIAVSLLKGTAVKAQGTTCANVEYATVPFGAASIGSSVTTDSWGNVYTIGANAPLIKMDSLGNVVWRKFGTDGNAVAVDSRGNIYTCANGVTKFDSSGLVIWTSPVPTRGGLRGWSIGVDGFGNSYITGNFQDTVVVGSTTIGSKGSTDIFIAKVNTNGQWEWILKAGGTSADAGMGIAVDVQGNSYVGGYFSGAMNFGTISVSSAGSEDAFVAKLNSAGQFQWVTNGGGPQADNAYALAMDSANNCYITGYCQNQAVFGPTTISLTSVPRCIFVAKINAQGVWQGAVNSINSTTYISAWAIAADRSGNSYITGYFGGDITFGNTTKSSVGQADVFIARLNSNLQWDWLRTSGIANTAVQGYGITADNKGNCYAIGYGAAGTKFDTTTLTSNGLYVVKISSGAATVTGDTSYNITCGESVQLNVAASGYQFLFWTNGNTLSDQSIANPIASPTVSTVYTVTVLDLCSNLDSAQVTVNVLPLTLNATATPTNIACGDVTNLLVTPSSNTLPISYSWTPAYRLSDPYVANPTANPGTTTTYTVSGSTSAGCNAIDSITINVTSTNPPQTVITSTTTDFKLCNVNGIQLDAGSGFSAYTWSTGQNTQTITAYTAGTYSVTIDDQTGCSGKATAEVLPLVNITAPNGTLLCAGQSNTLTLNADGGFSSYEWNTSDQTQGIQVTQPGVYTVSVTDANCAGQASIVVTQNTGQATADYSYTGAGGRDVTFTAIGNGINFLSWDFGDGGTSIDPNPTHTFAANGTYTVELTITDVCGQTASKSKSITVPVVTGVKNAANDNISWLVYPNPTDKLINIAVDGLKDNYQLEVWNVMGEKVSTTLSISNTITTIDLSTNPQGVYFIKLTSGDGFWTGRVVKQ